MLDDAHREGGRLPGRRHRHLATTGKQSVLHPRLVGLADFRDGGSTNGATITLFDTATAQDLFLRGADGFSDVWVTAEPGVSQDELRDQVAAMLPAGYEAVTGDEAAEEAASGVLEAIWFISMFLLIFAGIALVVGSFLIVNTFSILVAQRSRELALLRALGASRRQVTRSVLFEAVLLGTVGATIGLGLGVLLAMGIRALFASFGLDLSGQPLVFAPRTSWRRTSSASGSPRWRPTSRPAGGPDRPGRRAARRHRDAGVGPALAAVVGVAMLVSGAALMLVGLFADVPKPGYWVGGGILVALLGVAVASPVLGRPSLPR